jgi:hypothetical protein
VNTQSAEPPCTVPYARWCGRGGAARLPPIPIYTNGVESDFIDMQERRTRPNGVAWPIQHSLLAFESLREFR